MKINIPATSANLGPGYDTLGISLKLVNTVEIEKSSKQAFQVIGEGANNHKVLNKNIFLEKFVKCYKSLTNEEPSFRFIFNNRIPISRGLGSSSAVIVGALASAYHLADKEISKQEILNLAIKQEKHPDNLAPAVYGGFTTSILNNGKVLTITKKIPKSVVSIVVIPNKPISTRYARSVLPTEYSKSDVAFNISKSSYLASAFMSENWEALALGSQDRIHEYYRMKLYPSLFYIKKKLTQCGSLMSTLSGSGSTMFSLFYRDDADKALKNLNNIFPDYKVLMIDFDNKGYDIFE